MSEAWDLLRESVLAQAELGAFEVHFDEPWSITRKAAAAPQAPAAAPPAPVRTAAPPAPPRATPAPRVSPAAPAAPPPPRVHNDNAPLADLTQLMSMAQEKGPSSEESAWERARDTQSFHQCLPAHPLYQELCGGAVIAGHGPVGAPFMLVFHSPTPPDLMEQTVLSGAPGELLTRLLASLKVDRSACYSTYFFKGLSPARILPRQILQLRKMLQAEVALVRPAAILVFGEKTYLQALDGKIPFLEAAGSPVEFAGVPATALIDPADMLDSKELKLLTWNNHIPRCGFFKK